MWQKRVAFSLVWLWWSEIVMNEISWWFSGQLVARRLPDDIITAIPVIWATTINQSQMSESPSASYYCRGQLFFNHWPCHTCLTQSHVSGSVWWISCVYRLYNIPRGYLRFNRRYYRESGRMNVQKSVGNDGKHVVCHTDSWSANGT